MSFFDPNTIAKEQLHGVSAAIPVAPPISIIGAHMSSPSRKRLVYVDVISLIGGVLALMIRRKRKRMKESE